MSFLIRKLTYSLVPQTTMTITATDKVAIGWLTTTRAKCCSLSVTHAVMVVEYEYAIAKYWRQKAECSWLAMTA